MITEYIKTGVLRTSVSGEFILYCWIVHGDSATMSASRKYNIPLRP